MEENISAYPQAVTRQMLQNFATGGACISVIAKSIKPSYKLVDCGSVGEAYEGMSGLNATASALDG